MKLKYLKTHLSEFCVVEELSPRLKEGSSENKMAPSSMNERLWSLLLRGVEVTGTQFNGKQSSV